MVALRNSPLWEIRARSDVPSAHGSRTRKWLDEEDPEFGLSAAAFELLRNAASREPFVAALQSLTEQLTALAGEVVGGWEIFPGAMLRRRAVHEVYGGNRQSGISPSAKSANILLFFDLLKGRQHGYFDGWGDDGCFHYTGTGQVGDQRMDGDNQAILEHRDSGRPLRLFQVTKKSWVRYLGKFALDPESPWYASRAPATGGGPLRSVLVFRLRPDGDVDEGETAASAGIDTSSQVLSIPLEEAHVTGYKTTRSREEATAVRREGKLVQEYAAYLRSLGHKIDRKNIRPAGQAGPLLTDLYDETVNDLVEAKSDVSRDSIRMAVGQLFDYRRFIQPSPRLNILVPVRPREDLLHYCASVDVTVIWKAESVPGWDRS